MNINIFTVSNWAANGVTVALLLCSILYCFRRRTVSYLRFFPVYALLNFVATFLPQLFHHVQIKTNFIFSILETLYFSGFLYVLFRSSAVRKALLITDGLWTALIIFLALHINKPGIDVAAGLLECGITVPFCLLWFREVFKDPPYDRLVDQPSYWFVTGMLFYTSVLMPTLFFSYNAYSEGQRQIAHALYSANNYAEVISYALFGIGIVWKGRTAAYFIKPNHHRPKDGLPQGTFPDGSGVFRQVVRPTEKVR